MFRLKAGQWTDDTAMALALAMPLLAVWTTLSALLGGMLAADLAMGVTPAYFFAALPRAVQVSNLTLAVGKSVVFGILIALIGCHYGLRVKPNTESLGQGTTASVVTSSRRCRACGWFSAIALIRAKSLLPPPSTM